MVKVSRLLIFLLFLSGFATLQAAQKFENPRDGILMISSKEFRSSSPGIWEYVEKMTDFPFDEMIYSWNLRLAEGEGFRLYISLYMSDDTESPWLYAGYWGSVKPRGDDIMTTFSAGIVDYDHVKLTASARGLRFRVVSEGAKPLAQAPEMRVIFTDNYTEAEPVKAYVEIPARVLDVPLRAQTDTSGVRIPDTCQSAALCSAMQYFGKEVPLEEVAEMIRDPEYHLRGIWPRIVGASIQKGFNAYIDRFRNWTKVREALSANKVILCSITMPENDTYIDPP